MLRTDKDMNYAAHLGSFQNTLKRFVESDDGKDFISQTKNRFGNDLKFMIDFEDIGLDCSIFYLEQKIINQVKPLMDLINNFIYPFLKLLDIVDAQQSIACM